MKKYRFTDDDYKELARQLDEFKLTDGNSQASLMKTWGDGHYTINIITKGGQVNFFEETLYFMAAIPVIYRWYRYADTDGVPLSDFDKESLADVIDG